MVGRQLGHPFSGPRSRVAASGARGLLRQHRDWMTRSVATANGACARVPEPPTLEWFFIGKIKWVHEESNLFSHLHGTEVRLII